MKHILFIVFTCILVTNLLAQNPSFTILKNEDIYFHIDSSKWNVQDPNEVFNSLENKKSFPNMTGENIVGLFTYEKEPIINHPSIMIINTVAPTVSPATEELGNFFGAYTISLEEKGFETEKELTEFIKTYSFEKPLLIKEKRQILTQTSKQLPKQLELVTLASYTFSNRNIVTANINYVKDWDEEYLEEFFKVLETLELNKE